MDEEIDYVKKMDSHASSLQKHTSRSHSGFETAEAEQEKRPKQNKKNGSDLFSNIHIQMSRNQICVKLTNELQCPQKNNKHVAICERVENI